MSSIDVDMEMPIVTLQTGLRVGNFSSPHSFIFATGEILPACSAERAKLLQLNTTEWEDEQVINGIPVVDINLLFEMSPAVSNELGKVAYNNCVDIVIVPLPVLECLRKQTIGLQNSKFRGCRVADRVKKTIFGDRFCI